MNIIDQHKESFGESVEYFKRDISSLRTGRATPALVEDVTVEAYGQMQPLKTVASISVIDAKTLGIEAWDKSVMMAIEQGIRKSDLGINPVNDGKLIRIPLPDLSTERRQELIKVLHQKSEQAKISVRKIREDIKKAIESAEKDGDISEDEKYKQVDVLDKMVKDTNEKVKQIAEEKEKEINTI